MKQKFFYSHLIETTDISLKFTKMDLTEDEKSHLVSLLEANIHSTVIDNVLSELSSEDKKQFLKNLISDDHQVTLDHLKVKIDKFEEKIKDSAERLKRELLRDIATAQKLTEANNS